MYTVALTGGIASGKSEVARRFVARGAALVDADRVSRELVEPGMPALAEIAATFGTGMIGTEGRLDRAALRARVFADPAERTRLEAILHPRIRATMRERALAATAPYVVLDIPLLVESHAHYAWADRVLVVDVPREIQIRRLVARDGIDAALAEAMVAAQATREQRLAIADDVVDNSGLLEALDARIDALHAGYLAAAGIGR